MKYNLARPWETLDSWQKEVISYRGNMTIITGRQCGKSTAVSQLAGERAARNSNEFILIGASVIDQTELIFWKIKAYMHEKHRDKVIKETLHFMELKNGSKIICVPVGDTGNSMRGYTATMLILDEAAIIPDRAWEAIEPIISITKGQIVLLSTPQQKEGFFYKASINPNYKTIKVSARDCPRHRKEFLDQKEAELSPVAFATEYLGEFIDDYNRKFSEEWIEKVCVLEKGTSAVTINCNILGVDVGGGVGKGETTFEGFNAADSKNIFQNVHIFSDTIAGPDIERQIKKLKRRFNYDRKSIGYDATGEGSGSFKYMEEDDELKRCIVALNNATRPVGRDGRTTKLLKEFMYDLVEEMGWRGELKCFNEGSIKQSFRSIQIEFKKNGERRYWGTYSHIVEGIVRATWLAKNKSLNIYIY